jgi:LmbE family N-acetylglucosaminyl deacetylase
MLKKMVISPHIDDEVLGCGGIIDEKTFIVECGVDEFHIVSREERILELEKVQQALGFKYRVYDNQVNRYEIAPIIEQVTQAINQYRPDEIYIPYPSYNQDHQVVYKACMVALRPHDVNYFVKKVFVYEETQVIAWDYSHSIGQSFKPNFFREIDIEKKLACYEMLKSQVRSFRSPEFLRELAQIRGRQAMVKNAEAFQCLRYVE